MTLWPSGLTEPDSAALVAVTACGAETAAAVVVNELELVELAVAVVPLP